MRAQLCRNAGVPTQPVHFRTSEIWQSANRKRSLPTLFAGDLTTEQIPVGPKLTGLKMSV